VISSKNLLDFRRTLSLTFLRLPGARKLDLMFRVVDHATRNVIQMHGRLGGFKALTSLFYRAPIDLQLNSSHL
jgi:hypothetical protein